MAVTQTRPVTARSEASPIWLDLDTTSRSNVLDRATGEACRRRRRPAHCRARVAFPRCRSAVPRIGDDPMSTGSVSYRPGRGEPSVAA
jgi:hypothetical protein